MADVDSTDRLRGGDVPSLDDVRFARSLSMSTSIYLTSPRAPRIWAASMCNLKNPLCRLQLLAMFAIVSLFIYGYAIWSSSPKAGVNLLACGRGYYSPLNHTCFDGEVLSPISDRVSNAPCVQDCATQGHECCSERPLLPPETPSVSDPSSACLRPASSLQLSDPPYENFFYSDCHINTQVVITSPLSDSDLSLISPRLVVAWPAGNSGACAFFEPKNGVNGSLAISLVPFHDGTNLTSISINPPGSRYPSVGVKGILCFNSSALLTVSILGSIRAIRDFTEGASRLHSVFQDAISLSSIDNKGAALSRLWLDNETITTLSFEPLSTGTVVVDGDHMAFAAGEYVFSAHFNYPQLDQLSTEKVFNPASQRLATEQQDAASSLAFLSYTEKLLAGAWRFLTYFGRDSMISALLLEPVLSRGPGSAMEAVIGAALERIDRTDGSACHEETIGDYATLLQFEMNRSSTEPQFDYSMVDTDYFLPILMQRYLEGDSVGKPRYEDLLAKKAGKIDSANLGLTFADLARLNAERVMNLTAPFASPGGQKRENLIGLKDDTIVGQWRDSSYGSGGGRIPYDVNTALVPAALRAIAALSRLDLSIYVGHEDWATLADEYAKVWEDETLTFFQITIAAQEARSRLDHFASSSNFYRGPSHAEQIDGDVTFHGLALEGSNSIANIDVMHTDDCFRLFLLNTTKQEQLTSFLNQSALNIMRGFPAGLMTSVGVVVANPAFASHDILRKNFTNSAYHGTVVWSWQLAMMARGLETQLGRCDSEAGPAFCTDSTVYSNVKQAYNALWYRIEENDVLMSQEVWSWVFEEGDFRFKPLGSLSPPPGVSPGTESNVRQLWSLAFLAVRRNGRFR